MESMGDHLWRAPERPQSFNSEVMSHSHRPIRIACMGLDHPLEGTKEREQYGIFHFGTHDEQIGDFPFFETAVESCLL